MVVVAQDGSVGQSLDGLLDDAQALPHLFEADQVARVGVASRSHGHVEIVVLIAEVGALASEVVGHAAGPQAWPRPAPTHRLLRGQRVRSMSFTGEQSVRRDPAMAQKTDHQCPAIISASEMRRGAPLPEYVENMIADSGAVFRSGVTVLPAPTGESLFHCQALLDRIEQVDCRRDARRRRQISPVR